MHRYLRQELDKIDQQPQRQDAALDQLRDLYAFANRLGLYDAADLIRTMTEKADSGRQSAFPQRIMELLIEVADRKGTATRGPWEDGNGQPLQDDAAAAIAWIRAR